MTDTPKPLSGDAYWNLLETTAKRVDTWPDWKKGGRKMDTPKPQPDLSDEWLDYLANRLHGCSPEILKQRLRSVRDQARVAERRKTLRWAVKTLCANKYGTEKQIAALLELELRRAAEKVSKDAHEHRFDSLRIRDDDGRVFHVCLECGAREYEEGSKDA